MDQDLVARLRLIRSPGIGPVSFRHLLARFPNAEAAIAAIPELARRGGGRPPRLATIEAVSREIERVAALGARHIFAGQPNFPACLDAIDTSPPVLIAQGDLRLLERTGVALVGARNASAAACRVARQLSSELGQAGIVVVSGLARGIDTAAHQGALASGTIAVIAGGIDIYYPPENEGLQREIAALGLVVTEQPPGVEPKAGHFPTRNRIIAGLSLGTVVVEAAPRSGSLITARLAGDFGREVMAVPGSPLDPRAQGCNGLIRDGATLVQSAADIIEALGPIGGGAVTQPILRYGSDGPSVDASDAERTAVVGLLGPVAISVDELIRQSGYAPSVIQLILLELELAGRLERHAGGRVSLIDMTA
jgi:DNA processing protein